MEIYLKLSVESDFSNFTKHHKIQITDITTFKIGNSGNCLLPLWKIACNDRNGAGQITNFIRATKLNSPTSDSGATNLPSIEDTFIYGETSQDNGNGVNVRFERTDIIQSTKITLYYNRVSIVTYDSLNSMG